jgi:NAD(P)-dependent dehydrogenase (short-subunit alcohol dehydrogenase family)
MVTVADRDADAGERLAAYIVSTGGRAQFVQTDVASEDSVQAMVDRTVEAFGRLDVLVNVAGVNILARLTDTTVELATGGEVI